MNRILFTLFLTLPFISQAKLLPDFSGPIACEKSLKEKIKNEFKKNKITWIREANHDFETQTFKVSKAVGEWFELRLSPNQPPQMSYISKNKNIDFVWAKKGCKIEEKAGGVFQFFNQASGQKEETFSDQDMMKLLKSKKQGFIYVWSPRMVYSVQEMKRYQKVAADLHIEFVPVLDPQVPSSEALAALKTLSPELPKERRLASQDISIKRMDSVELYMRDTTLHFPSLIVFKNGKIHDQRIIGILTRTGIKNSVETLLKEMN